MKPSVISSEVKAMIEDVTVSELKTLLKASKVHFKMNQRKSELQRKCLEAARKVGSLLTEELVREQHENWKQRRRTIVKRSCNRIQRRNASSASSTETSASATTLEPLEEEPPLLNDGPVTDDSPTLLPRQVSPYGNGSTSDRSGLSGFVAQQEDPSRPLQIKFRESPFFVRRAVLLQPSVLVSSASVENLPNLSQTFRRFTLTREQADEYLEVGAEVQLRFCKYDANADPATLLEDRLPLNLEVRCNGQVLHHPVANKSPATASGQEQLGKRPSAPLVITNVHVSTTNHVFVGWGSNNPARGFALAAYLVKRVPTDEIFNQLITKGNLNRQETIDLIKAASLPPPTAVDCNNMNATGPKTIQMKVSIVCPIGKQRMKWPCRSIKCQHPQCFDAKVFLAMCEMKPFYPFHCPVCFNIVKLEDLRIDGYFVEVLGKLSPRAGNMVELLPDGNWLAMKGANQGSSSASQRDNDHGGSTNRPTVEFVDLVLKPFASAIKNRNETDAPEVVDLDLES